MPRDTLSPLSRGLVFGLLGGLFIGGAALLGWGALQVFGGPDCTQLSPEECALQREIAVTLGRRQVLFGGALALLGIALFLMIRARGTDHEVETPAR